MFLKWHLIAVVASTFLAIVVSVYCLNAGHYTVFQNLFYFPIIISCIYYLKRGLVFSVLLAVFYFFIIACYTADLTVIHEAVIRVGFFVAIAGVLTFISLQRKRAEHTLYESEERFRAVVEDQTEIISRLRPDGTLIFVNDVFCRFFGKNREDMLNTGWQPRTVAEDIPEIERRLSEMSPLNPVIIIENRVYDANDTVRWMQFVNRGFFDAGGQLIEIQSVGRDITGRRQAEEALEKSYAILKGVVESPREVVIFALDPQYRYIAFNENHSQTMKRIWGADISLGISMLEYIKTPEDRQKAKDNFDRALAGESFTLVEEYGDTALERRYYEDIYNPIIDENGNVLGLTLFLSDITDRKYTEDEKERLIVELKESLAKIKTLRGLLPICAWCKKIRDDAGYWQQLESYIRKYSDAEFSHSICPECLKEKFPGFHGE